MLDSKYSNLIIKKEDIKEQTLTNHIKILKQFGNDLSSNEAWIEFIIRDQIRTLEYWLNFFDKYLINQETRKWILNSLQKMARYNIDKGKFARRNKHTIHPFPEINRICVLEALNNQDLSFKSIYEDILHKLLDEKTDIGIWQKYSTPKDAQKLSFDIQGYFTRWCIANEEVSYLHLLAGDIYVYYTICHQEYIYPRIAIQVKKDTINRIVGLNENQELEENLTELVFTKSKELNARIEHSLERKLLRR